MLRVWGFGEGRTLSAVKPGRSRASSEGQTEWRRGCDWLDSRSTGSSARTCCGVKNAAAASEASPPLAPARKKSGGGGVQPPGSSGQLCRTSAGITTHRRMASNSA